MAKILGVQAVGTMNSAQHDTAGSKAPILHIEHSFFQDAQEVESETRYVVQAQIQLKNAGAPALEDIYVYINIQGSAQEGYSSPYVCDADGKRSDPGPGSRFPAIFFGNLGPGKQSPALTYYWSLEPGFSDPILDIQSFAVTPVLIPKFTVSYTNQELFNTDTTTVRVSA